jgi:hypothetical protein
MKIITWLLLVTPKQGRKKKMFDWLNSIKVPTGYSSNIQRIINYKEKKNQKFEGS